MQGAQEPTHSLVVGCGDLLGPRRMLAWGTSGVGEMHEDQGTPLP